MRCPREAVTPYADPRDQTRRHASARPLEHVVPVAVAVDPDDADRICAFCLARVLETTPEIARLGTASRRSRPTRSSLTAVPGTSEDEVRDFSDVLRPCHAATGVGGLLAHHDRLTGPLRDDPRTAASDDHWSRLPDPGLAQRAQHT